MFSENVHSVLFMIWYILFKLSFQNDGFCCNVALFHCPIYAENFLFTRTLPLDFINVNEKLSRQLFVRPIISWGFSHIVT